jgi:hypothetical protein
MTPNQKVHAKKAAQLGARAAETIESTKTGKSGVAAKLLHEQNIERDKAGLIAGGYKPNKIV